MRWFFSFFLSFGSIFNHVFCKNVVKLCLLVQQKEKDDHKKSSHRFFIRETTFSSVFLTLRRPKKKKKKKNVVGGGAKDAPLFPAKGGVLSQRKEVVFEEKSRERINPKKRVL